MTGTVEIDRLRVYARHGVAEQERIVGNTFEVSARLRYPLGKACSDDSIADTLDYGEAIALIRREMRESSLLIEHAAWRIVNALTTRFPLIEGGMVKVTKVTPPCGVEVKGVSTILEW